MTHFKQAETFHYTHFTLCHPQSVKIALQTPLKQRLRKVSQFERKAAIRNKL